MDRNFPDYRGRDETIRQGEGELTSTSLHRWGAFRTGVGILTWSVVLVSFFGKFHFIPALFQHWSPHLGIAAAVVSLALPWRSWWVRGGLALLGFGVALSPLVRLHTEPPSRSPTDRASEFTVVTANLRMHHGDPRLLLPWLRERAVDLVGFQEITEQFEDHGREIRTEFPHRKVVPRPDTTGIGLWSRFPITDSEPFVDSRGLLQLRAEVEVRGEKILVFVLHPHPPIFRAEAEANADLLSTVAASIRRDKRRVLVLADLNLTPWSAGFRRFCEDSGLLHARQGHGYRATWPDVIGPWWGIPIDHVLCTPPVHFDAAEVGPDINSDHRPLLVRLRF